jgi:Pyruvate/2-oxoacid:ferredoxin oxidoreductase delta subunit
VARVFADDAARMGSREQFPYVATTYSITEMFRHWTKHSRLNAIVQPEQFIELSEKLADRKGIKAGDMIRVSSKRGHIKGKAVVTKRVMTLQVDGQEIEQIGIPCHWGYEGTTRKGYLANTLSPGIGDANAQTPSSRPFWSTSKRHKASTHDHAIPRYRAALGHQRAHARRPHATTRPRSPNSSTSASALAARPARWPAANGTICATMWARTSASTTTRATSRPSWTLMRFDEYVNEQGKLEWLIRKDGCMHCEDPGCLKACPQPGAIVQYANGIVDFQSEQCIGCGYCVAGCPSTSRASARRTTRPTSARCARTAWPWARSRPASRPAPRAPSRSAARTTC